MENDLPSIVPQVAKKGRICLRYAFPVGHLRSCVVSFCDPQGNGRFSVEVTAESKFEAAVRALQLFRQEPWCTEAACATGYLEVSAALPAVQYKILLDDLRQWLHRTGGSPRETAQRQRLKAMLE